MSRVRRQDSIKCCYLGSYDAEHRLRGLLAQTVELFALRCPQTPGHGFDRCQGRLPVSTAARTAKPPKPRPASQQKRTKSIDISSIQSAFHRVEKNAASGNANNLRKFLGELQRAVEEALK